MSEARVPLQIGASSSRNAVLGGGLIVPGLFVLGYGFGVPGFGWLVVIMGVAMVGLALQCLALAWRERPSDLSITPEHLQIEGGPHHGFSVERSQIQRVSLREDLGAAGAGPSFEIGLADDASRVIAHSEEAGDRSRFERLREVLLARTTLPNAAPLRSARTVQRHALSVLLCIAGAWPLAGALYRAMDQHNASSSKALAVLAIVPLIVAAVGFFVMRAWVDERRGAKESYARATRPIVFGSLPVLVAVVLLARTIAHHARDVSPMPEAHGFEASGPPAPVESAAVDANVPAGAHDVRHVSTADGDVLSYIVDAEGASTLTFDGHVILTTEPGVTIRGASFDPSGTRVAYLRQEGAAASSARVSFTTRGAWKDADAQTVAETADFVAWSPKKQQIAYATSARPVHVGIVATPFVKDAPAANSGFGAEKPVTGAGEWGTDPAWSPDGSQLAYLSYGTEHFGVHQVYVLDSSFENPARQLTQGDTDCTAIEWTADGWIAFTARGGRLRVKP